jgi:hypothetical protein
MPNLNEFFDKKDSVENDEVGVEVIEQMRPCATCDLFVDSYKFNNQTLEMYWKCLNGHDTRYRVG